MEIQIHHIENSDRLPKFEAIHSMGVLHGDAVTLADPAEFPADGFPLKKLLPELRWYLEDYLQNPFGAYPQLAESIAKVMQAWGTAVFDALFTGHARDWYQDAKRKGSPAKKHLHRLRMRMWTVITALLAGAGIFRSWNGLYSASARRQSCCMGRQGLERPAW